METLEKVQFWLVIVIIPAVIGLFNLVGSITGAISEKLQNEKAGKVSVFCGKAVGIVSKLLDFLLNKRA